MQDRSSTLPLLGATCQSEAGGLYIVRFHKVETQDVAVATLVGTKLLMESEEVGRLTGLSHAEVSQIECVLSRRFTPYMGGDTTFQAYFATLLLKRPPFFQRQKRQEHDRKVEELNAYMAELDGRHVRAYLRDFPVCAQNVLEQGVDFEGWELRISAAIEPARI